MNEGEGSVFWDGQEDGFGATFEPETFLNNHCFEPEIQSNNDEESSSKRIRLSPESNLQEGDAESSSKGSSSLGLTLTLSDEPPFLSDNSNTNNTRSRQSSDRDNSNTNNTRSRQSSDRDNSNTNNTRSRQSRDRDKSNTKNTRSRQSMGERLKASNFPAVHIKIGSWQRFTRHEGDLTAKLYFAKRKMVWEVLDGALKKKIEIQWSDIIAIRATTPENEPGTLEIDLNQPPLFYREVNPQPRKHTLWQQASDFTGGQAPAWRRHHVTFQTGMLDKHLNKLFNCDNRLLELSQQPFPSQESLYFDPTMHGLSGMSLSFNRFGSGPSGYTPAAQYPYQAYPTIPRAPTPSLIPNPSVSVMGMSFRNVGGSSNQFVRQQQPTYWGQGPSHLTPAAMGSQVFHGQNYYQSNSARVTEIKNLLLGDESVADEGDLHLLKANDVNPNHNADHWGKDHLFAADNCANKGMQYAGNMNLGEVDGVSTQPDNWLPPLEFNDTMLREQEYNDSLQAWLFPGNPTTYGDFSTSEY